MRQDAIEIPREFYVLIDPEIDPLEKLFGIGLSYCVGVNADVPADIAVKIAELKVGEGALSGLFRDRVDGLSSDRLDVERWALRHMRERLGDAMEQIIEFLVRVDKREQELGIA